VPLRDGYDGAIVTLLQKNAWLSYVELGRLVHLSASAVQRRVERLRRDGVILGAQAQIAPAALGRGILLFVLVELRDESARHLKGMQRQMMREPGVKSVHYVAGSTDLIVEYLAAAMDEYAAFAERCLNGEANVRRYSTLTVLKTMI